MANTFSFCEGTNEDREEVFMKYCDALEYACEKLKKKNVSLLCYSLLSVETEWNREEMENKDSLKRLNDILANVHDAKKTDGITLVIISNLDDNNIANSIEKKCRNIDVRQLDKDNLESIDRKDNNKILFLVDTQKKIMTKCCICLG